MIEEWKCIKEYKSDGARGQGLHLKGDKIYVSNTGRVKLNDIELTLDKGLYINKGYEICIVGTSWPFDNMHRTIYQLFTGKLKKGWNIHHIDGNHYNNRLDNLVQLTAFEHGRVHAEHDNDWGDSNPRNRDWVKQQEARADQVINDTKEWLYNRVIDYHNNKSKIVNEKRKNKLVEKRIDKEKEDADKLATGNYFYTKAGVLRKKTSSKKGYKMSEEEKKKHSIAAKLAYEKDPTLRNRVNNKESIEKTRATLSSKRTGSKLIVDENGKRTWKYKN